MFLQDCYTPFFHTYANKISLSRNYVKWIVSITAAFIASLFACIFSQPGDMILTETYRREDCSTTEEKMGKNPLKKILRKKKQEVEQQSSVQSSQKSFLQVIDTIYSQGGFPRFFTGTGARIVHVGLIIDRKSVV